MDEEIDIADESLPTFTIPSTNKKAAIKFILDTIHDTLNDANWSIVQFDSPDPDKLDLYELWCDIEPLLEDEPLPEMRLSSASPDCLILKCEGRRHRSVKNYFASALTVAAQARTGRVYDVTTEFPSISGRAVGDRPTKYVPDIAVLDDNDNPRVWCEVADSQSFRKVQQKIMCVGSVCPTIVTFVIIHIFPEGGGRLPNYNPDFLIDFQVSRRLTRVDQLGDGEFCTLGVAPTYDAYPITDPETRELEENYDSYLVNRRVFEFMEPVESPIMRRVGDDTLLRLAIDERAGAEDGIDGDDDNFTLPIDLRLILDQAQRTRDRYALTALNLVQEDADNRPRTGREDARQEERDRFRDRLTRVPEHLNTAYAARIVGVRDHDPATAYLEYRDSQNHWAFIPQAVYEAMLLR